MLEWVNILLDIFRLDNKNLSLGLFMLTSSKIVLTSTKLDKAELLKEIYVFTISLLGATIQDSDMREKSNVFKMRLVVFYLMLQLIGIDCLKY